MAFALEGPQVAHDAVGRADIEMFANLSHGWSIPTMHNLVVDEIVDLLLALGEWLDDHKL